MQIEYASEVPIYGFQLQLLCDGEVIEFSRVIENDGEAKVQLLITLALSVDVNFAYTMNSWDDRK